MFVDFSKIASPVSIKFTWDYLGNISFLTKNEFFKSVGNRRRYAGTNIKKMQTSELRTSSFFLKLEKHPLGLILLKGITCLTLFGVYMDYIRHTLPRGE